jgi:hypothetical protein
VRFTVPQSPRVRWRQLPTFDHARGALTDSSWIAIVRRTVGDAAGELRRIAAHPPSGFLIKPPSVAVCTA